MMAMYPSRFSSDPSLGPKNPKTKSKRSVGQMACKTKKTSTKSKKSSSKKKPC